MNYLARKFTAAAIILTMLTYASFAQTLPPSDSQKAEMAKKKAEEKAARLPIYMAFPLWFCIMPALFVILLAPSLITFFEQAPQRASSNFK